MFIAVSLFSQSLFMITTDYITFGILFANVWIRYFQNHIKVSLNWFNPTVHNLVVDSWILGEIGNHVTMSCQVQPSRQNMLFSGIIEWKKGCFIPKRVARVAMHNSIVMSNTTYGERSLDFSIDSSGDFTIWNLIWDDAGLYTCSITRSPHKIIQLYLKGMSN